MLRIGFRLPRMKRILFALGAVVIFGGGASSLVINLANEDSVDASSNNGLYDVMPSQMKTLSLTKVFSGAEVDGSVNSTQSFAITNNYFIAVQAHSSNEDAGWIIATSLTSPSSTPAWKVSHNVGHGNGATYNSKTNEIVVIDGSSKHFFNGSNGSYKNTVSTGASGTGIAYDKEDNYYIQTSGRGSSSGRILNSSFETLSTFDAAHPLVNQDVAYYDGYIYRIGWGGCSYLSNSGLSNESSICYNYFGEGSNAIYQFNMQGDFVKAFYISAGTGELESMAFSADGTPYLLINGDPDSSHYSVYKVNNMPKSQTVSFANASVTKTYGDAGFTNKATTTGDGAISYASSNTNVATVNASTGAVTIKGAGTTTITATAAATTNYNSASKTYTLMVNKAGHIVSFADEDPKIAIDYGEEDYANTASSTVQGLTIRYRSSNEDVATVDNNGKITTLKSGVTTITATASSSNYLEKSVSYELSVQYVLSFDNNEGIGEIEEQRCVVAEGETIDTCAVSIPSTTPTREDYFFLGWSEDEEAEIEMYRTDDEVELEDNLTVYAIWADGAVTWQNGKKHTVGDGEKAVFKVNMPLSHFESIAVDDEILSGDKYDLSEGSTIISLHADYLDTLDNGTHEVTITFDDGAKIYSGIEIERKAAAPNTGDNLEVRNVVVESIIVAPVILVASLLYVKRTKTHHRKFD